VLRKPSRRLPQLPDRLPEKPVFFEDLGLREKARDEFFLVATERASAGSGRSPGRRRRNRLGGRTPSWNDHPKGAESPVPGTGPRKTVEKILGPRRISRTGPLPEDRLEKIEGNLGSAPLHASPRPPFERVERKRSSRFAKKGGDLRFAPLLLVLHEEFHQKIRVRGSAPGGALEKLEEPAAGRLRFLPSARALERAHSGPQLFGGGLGIPLGRLRLPEPNPVQRLLGLGTHERFENPARVRELARLEVTVGRAEQVDPRLAREPLPEVQLAEPDEGVRAGRVELEDLLEDRDRPGEETGLDEPVGDALVVADGLARAPDPRQQIPDPIQHEQVAGGVVGELPEQDESLRQASLPQLPLRLLERRFPVERHGARSPSACRTFPIGGYARKRFSRMRAFFPALSLM